MGANMAIRRLILLPVVSLGQAICTSVRIAQIRGPYTLKMHEDPGTVCYRAPAGDVSA